MERVLIVAKTKMGESNTCIGALVLSTNKNIRLLTSNGSKQPITTEFGVGQLWDLDFQPGTAVIPPHVEDVVVHAAKYIAQQANLRAFLMERIEPWQGGLEQLFDGSLTSVNQSCFVPEYITPPDMSTGFWLLDTPLERGPNPQFYVSHVHIDEYDEYGIRDKSIHIHHVGYGEPLPCIPAGTLVRVSLARWYKPLGATEKRCYLQLSGWYL